MMEEKKNELMHYGVRGMKWGVRKDPYSGYNRIQRRKADGSALKNVRTGDRNGTVAKNVSKDFKSFSKAMTKKSGDGSGLQNLKVGMSTKPKLNRHERAANTIEKDAENLRKNGYTKEADAVQAVADKQRAKAEQIKKRKEELAERRANNKWEQLKVSAEKKPKKKRPEDMTDEELRKANQRLQQEQQYRQLTKQKKAAQKSAGRRYAEKILIGAAITIGQRYLSTKGPELISKGYDFVKDYFKFSKMKFDIDLGDLDLF